MTCVRVRRRSGAMSGMRVRRAGRLGGWRQRCTERVGARVEWRLRGARACRVLGRRRGKLTARAGGHDQTNGCDVLSTHGGGGGHDLLTRERQYAYTEIVCTGQHARGCDARGHRQRRR